MSTIDFLNFNTTYFHETFIDIIKLLILPTSVLIELN